MDFEAELRDLIKRALDGGVTRDTVIEWLGSFAAELDAEEDEDGEPEEPDI